MESFYSVSYTHLDVYKRQDLVCDEDVKIVLYILAESVAARLRENGFRCRVVEISVRDNELFLSLIHI